LGAFIIEVDKTAHLIMEPDQPAWKELVDFFGAEILTSDHTISRPILGKIVFNHPERMKKLNEITHPRVKEYLEKQMLELRQAHPSAVIILEVPLLYEAGMDQMCTQVWVVWVDNKTQISRLMYRDGITSEEAKRKIASQMSLDEKARRADFVIDNTGTKESSIKLATDFYRSFILNDKTE